jgi:predicted HTH transcriptional regulator
MKAEDNKPITVEKPKRKRKLSTRKRLMLAVSQEWNPITSPELREVYSSKEEWARKLIPKLKKEELT